MAQVRKDRAGRGVTDIAQAIPDSDPRCSGWCSCDQWSDGSGPSLQVKPPRQVEHPLTEPTAPPAPLGAGTLPRAYASPFEAQSLRHLPTSEDDMPVRRHRVRAELRVGAIGALADELVVKPVARSSARKSKPGPAPHRHGGRLTRRCTRTRGCAAFLPRRPSSQSFGFASDSVFTRRAPVSATVSPLVIHAFSDCRMTSEALK